MVSVESSRDAAHVRQILENTRRFLDECPGFSGDGSDLWGYRREKVLNGVELGIRLLDARSSTETHG